MKKGIAFFDLDGTITMKDTLLEFIKYSKGPLKFWFGFLLHSPYIISYKAGFITNQKAKEKVLTYFFRNMAVADFQKLCDQFSEKILPGLIRPGAKQEMNELKKKGVLIVVVSASPENWIQKWADIEKIELIATQLCVEKNKLTGKIKGLNCYGQEKVRRIKEQYNLSQFNEISAYGDSSGDKPMLLLAQHAYMKPFR